MSEHKKNILLTLPDLVEGEVEKRPSKTYNSPYVADILYEGKEYIGHTPALGCCGLCDKEATVMMSPLLTKNSKCDYTIYLSKVVDRGLTHNFISLLKDIKSYEREKTRMNSRFDFVGVDREGIPFIMEVKNVPLADYVDCTASEKKKLKLDDIDYKVTDKIAYFPDGYRKQIINTVSPRALKHIQELTEIRTTSQTRCIMCYVIQRPDASSFHPSNVDPIYRDAFKEAVKSGVEVITLQVRWDGQGVAHFMTDQLKLNL